MAFTYRGMGCAFHEHILHILCNSWMHCSDAFHAVLCLILLCNGQNIAEYKVYWLMGAPIINSQGASAILSFIGSSYYLFLLKQHELTNQNYFAKKITSKRKICKFTVNRDHINKK